MLFYLNKVIQQLWHNGAVNIDSNYTQSPKSVTIRALNIHYISHSFSQLFKTTELNSTAAIDHRKSRPYAWVLHSASLGRFVPHHASAVWRKAPLYRTIFRLNLEKKWLRPSACSCSLQVQRWTGVIFIIHCSYLVIPKLYFIEIEVNSIKGKICTVLKWRNL